MTSGMTRDGIETATVDEQTTPRGPSRVQETRPRAVPLWLFAGAVAAAAVMFVLWMTARSDLDAANGRLSDIEEAEAALPDLREIGQSHLRGLGVIDDSGEEYLSATFAGSTGLDDLEDLLEDLDFSPAVIDRIGNTRALDGTQTAEAPHVVATWTYHPDDGLSIVFERDDR